MRSLRRSRSRPPEAICRAGLALLRVHEEALLEIGDDEDRLLRELRTFTRTLEPDTRPRFCEHKVSGTWMGSRLLRFAAKL